MKKYWPIIRTLTFLIVGVMNTILIRSEDIGSFKNYLGYLLLILAAVDIIINIVKKVRRH